MTLVTSLRRRRGIALAMLVVWVFALLSGVAHACFAAPGGEPAHEHRVQGSVPTAAQAMARGAAAQAAALAEPARCEPRPEQAACATTCDQSLRALPKQPAKLDAPDLHGARAPSRARDEGLLATTAGVARAAAAAPPRPALPARVQFSRLAL